MNDDYEFDASEYDLEAAEEGEEDERDDHMAEFFEESGMPAATTLAFAYVSSDGEQSRREVDVRMFAETAWGPQLFGRCHQRNADRTFSIDRITNCTDVNTGMAVADVYDHLFDLYEKTPDYSFDQVVAKHIDTLRAALHLAHCGGMSHAEQTTIIKQICQQISGDKRIAAEPVDKLIARYSSNPSSGVDQTFRLLAGRLNKSLTPDSKASVIRLCSKVASLKGAVNSASQECIDYMTQRFAKAE